MPKEQWETDARDRFVASLDRQGDLYAPHDQDVVVDVRTGRNFDFELRSNDPTKRPIALEIFRLIDDKEDIAVNRAWSDIVSRLRSHLATGGIGGYLVSTPVFVVPKFKRAAFCQAEAEKIRKAILDHSGEDEFKSENYQFQRIEGLQEVLFSLSGRGGAYNPVSIAAQCLETLLPTKNEQLAVADHRRVVLILRSGGLVDTENILEACASIDFSSLDNIDEIVFESEPGRFDLVFDREVFDAVEAKKLPEGRPADRYLTWLTARLRQGDMGSFEIAQALCARFRPWDVLGEDARNGLISIGEACAKQEMFDSAMWVVRNLKDDPNPGLDHPYHKNVALGETQFFIATVRGRLCWLIHYVLAADVPDLYPELLSILEEYAEGKNLYVRSQVTVPLSVLLKRRAMKKGGDWILDGETRDRTRALGFQMLQANSKFPAILRGLARVFQFVKDITAEEARQVLETLSVLADSDAAADVECLKFLYGFYRPKWDPPFDGAAFAGMVLEELSGNSSLRRTAAWVLWRNLHDKGFQLKDVREAVQALGEGPYDERSFWSLYSIIEDILDEDNVLATELFEKALAKHDLSTGTSYVAGFYSIEAIFQQMRRSELPDQFVRAAAILIGRLSHETVQHFSGVEHGLNEINTGAARSVVKSFAKLRTPTE